MLHLSKRGFDARLPEKGPELERFLLCFGFAALSLALLVSMMDVSILPQLSGLEPRSYGSSVHTYRQS